MAFNDEPTERQQEMVTELMDEKGYAFVDLELGIQAIYQCSYEELNRGQMSMIIDDLMWIRGRKGKERPEYASLVRYLTGVDPDDTQRKVHS